MVRAPACHAGGRGFKSRLPRHFAPRAAVAQLVEQRTENPWVAGSSPAGGTISKVRATGFSGGSAQIVFRLLLAMLYLLGTACAQQLLPGSRIRLVCEQEPTLSVERTLSPEGNVDLPIIGRVNLGGKLVTEAERQLEQLAAAKLRSDRFVIAITLVGDSSAPIDFWGAVNRNGSVPFRSGITLADVAKLAEPNAAAATEAVEITSQNGKKEVVDLASRASMTLRPGDRVYFPLADQSNDVLILGGVARPGSKPFESGLTLASLIQLAGGVTGHGERNRIRLERKGREPRVLDLDSMDSDTKLDRGDVVVVPAMENGGFITINGSVARPGLVEYRPGMTLKEAVRAAGGLTVFAGATVTVKRLSEWKRRFDFDKIVAGQAPDLILKPADLIDVPNAKWQKVETRPPETKKGKSNPIVPPLSR